MDAGELTSIHGARVKAARRLAQRSARERDRAFLAEGPQAVREALADPGVVLEVFVTAAGAGRHADLVATAVAAGRPVHRVADAVMARLGETVTPQGLVAVCRFVDVALAAALAPPPRLAVVLAHVRDPGNAGTVLRTADAAGAGLVAFTDASVDPYNGKCVRAAAGSHFHLALVRDVPVATAIGELRRAGMRVLAADASGRHDLARASAAGLLAGPTAWVFGNEAWGLPGDTLALADEVVRIPIHGRAESLNLATAAAVCLYFSATFSQARSDARHDDPG